MTEHRPYNPRPLPDRLEDIQWLADTDENLTGAATRLGITTDALAKWLKGHGHHDLLERLRIREDPRPRGLRHLRVATPDDPPAPDDDLVTAHDLCTCAGISYRQLDYWNRTGRLIPHTMATPGSGNQRVYATAEVDVARLVALLLDAGVNVQPAFTAARDLAANGTTRLGRFTLTPIPGDAATPDHQGATP